MSAIGQMSIEYLAMNCITCIVSDVIGGHAQLTAEVRSHIAVDVEADLWSKFK